MWELANWTVSIPLFSKPGERYSYSNNGYYLLGYIAEQVHITQCFAQCTVQCRLTLFCPAQLHRRLPGLGGMRRWRRCPNCLPAPGCTSRRKHANAPAAVPPPARRHGACSRAANARCGAARCPTLPHAGPAATGLPSPQVSGVPLPQYFQENIFGPAYLGATFYDPSMGGAGFHPNTVRAAAPRATACTGPCTRRPCWCQHGRGPPQLLPPCCRHTA